MILRLLGRRLPESQSHPQINDKTLCVKERVLFREPAHPDNGEEMNVEEMSDEVLVEELKRSLDEKRKVLHDLRVMNRKIETLNAKLADSEALKGNFLSNIRNEINNPLTSILGLSRQISGGNIDPDSTQRMALMIYNEAFDLDFQLRNVFLAAELESGESRLSVSRVDVNRLILGLLDSFGHRAAEKNLTMDLAWNTPHEPGAAFYVDTDSEKLEGVLSNLLANAIEFNRDGKSVKIAISKEGKRLTISIEDEGIGIPEEQRQNLFVRFRQLDTGTQKAHRGHGLGLSISKALAEMLDGKISFTRAAHGGCVFDLSITEADAGVEVGTVSEEGNEFLF